MGGAAARAYQRDCSTQHRTHRAPSILATPSPQYRLARAQRLGCSSSDEVVSLSACQHKISGLEVKCRIHQRLGQSTPSVSSSCSGSWTGEHFTGPYAEVDQALQPVAVCRLPFAVRHLPCRQRTQCNGEGSMSTWGDGCLSTGQESKRREVMASDGEREATSDGER